MRPARGRTEGPRAPGSEPGLSALVSRATPDRPDVASLLAAYDMQLRGQLIDSSGNHRLPAREHHVMRAVIQDVPDNFVGCQVLTLRIP